MSVPPMKYRHELKYIISSAQVPLLQNRILSIMQLDPHVGTDGSYNIRSLYFDDYHNRCFYENLNGTDPREKYRIRIYNHSSERITLECKRKERGMTHKSTCPLTVEQAQCLVAGTPPWDLANSPSLLRKMMLEMRTQLLRPAVIVEYERIPYIYQNGNVRVTFDMNVSSSSSIDAFLGEETSRRPIMPPGQHLMEVKFDEYLPDFIYKNLNLGHLQQSNYSKYFLCRKFSLNK